MGRVLIISFVEWHGAYQRPQQMAVGLARLGWEVTYACPRYMHRRQPEGTEDAATGGVKVIEPACLSGARFFAPIGSFNTRLMRRALGRLGGNWDAVIFNDPRSVEVAATIPAKTKIFDAMDDLSALMHSEAAARKAEARAVEVADRIWTGTAIMAERLAGRHASVTFIPNGVDGESFANPDPARVEEVRAELAKLYTHAGEEAKAPLAGFFGMLNERLDTSLLTPLLEEGWRVLLVGPSTSQCPPLPTHERLQCTGWRAYEALPAWLACFDLAIIPYRTDGPNRFLYPVKAVEYLAGGKPVLSSALPDVERFLKEYVLIEAGEPGWRRVAKEWVAIKDDATARAMAGQAFARQRGWNAMAAEMAGALPQR